MEENESIEYSLTCKREASTINKRFLELFDEDGFLKIINIDKANCCFKCETIPKGLCKSFYINNIDDHTIVAKRDILKDEELFILYGIDYWKEHFMNYSLIPEKQTNDFNDRYNEDNKNSKFLRLMFVKIIDMTWLKYGTSMNNYDILEHLNKDKFD